MKNKSNLSTADIMRLTDEGYKNKSKRINLL